MLPLCNVRCVMTISRPGLDGNLSDHAVQFWLRAEPFALASVHSGGKRTLVDARGSITLLPGADHCTLLPAPPGVAFPPAGNEFSLQPWGPLTPADLEPGVRSVDGFEWQREWDLLDGRKVIRGRLEQVTDTDRCETALWLDPTTGLLLRAEQRETDPATGELVSQVVYSDYTYDVELPEEVFELPPPGMRLVVHDNDITQRLSLAEREEIDRIIARCDEGWRTGDPRRFREAWTFTRAGHLRDLPDRSRWLEAVRSTSGKLLKWESRVVSIRQSQIVPLHFTPYRCVMLPVGAKGVLRVDARLQFAWVTADGGEVETSYYLLKRSNGYRIVHWYFPGAENYVGKPSR